MNRTRLEAAGLGCAHVPRIVRVEWGAPDSTVRPSRAPPEDVQDSDDGWFGDRGAPALLFFEATPRAICGVILLSARALCGSMPEPSQGTSAVGQHFPEKGTVMVCVFPFLPGYFSRAARAISVMTELMFPHDPTLCARTSTTFTG